MTVNPSGVVKSLNILKNQTICLLIIVNLKAERKMKDNDKYEWSNLIPVLVSTIQNKVEKFFDNTYCNS